MAPPAYSDLGKQAKDLFNKNYHFGLVKLDCKTKTPTGVEFAVSGTSHNDTGRVNGSLETKYKISDYGVTLKEKWNTDNTLATEVSVEDQLVKGLKLAFDATFAPQSGTGQGDSTSSAETKLQIDNNIRIGYRGGRKRIKESFSVTCVFRSRKKTGTVKSSYKLDHINLNTDVDFDYAGPIIHGAGVIHYQGWLAGAQLSFDTGKSKLTKSNFAVGYQTPEFVLHTNVNDGQEFGGSVYQKVNDKLETGILLNWTAGSNATRFGLGCIYKLDKATSVRAKVNNSSQVGLGFSHKLRDGVSLTLSAIIEGKNINQGGHKLGLGLDLEA